MLVIKLKIHIVNYITCKLQNHWLKDWKIERLVPASSAKNDRRDDARVLTSWEGKKMSDPWNEYKCGKVHLKIKHFEFGTRPDQKIDAIKRLCKQLKHLDQTMSNCWQICAKVGENFFLKKTKQHLFSKGKNVL